MCSHAFVALPNPGFLGQDGKVVTVKGFIRASDVDEVRLLLFAKDCTQDKIDREGPWVVIERSVRVASYDGIRRHGANLAADVSKYFAPDEVTMH
ncbi:MAG TPA: hypothetical protein VGE48_00800 [Candidatus Paceibacterota bacterium]